MNTSTPARPTVPSKPPYRIYIALIAMIVGVRIFDGLTQNLEWAIQIYGSNTWWIVFAVASIVLSFLAGFYLRQHVPPIVAWLTCGIVGGATSVLTSPLMGTCIGLTAGGVAVHQGVRKYVFRCTWQTALPTFATGIATGFATAIAYLYFGRGTLTHELTTILAVLLGGACALVFWLCRIEPHRLAYWWPTTLLLFLCVATIGFVTTITVELYRRDRAMKNVQSADAGSQELYDVLGTTVIGRAVYDLMTPLYRNHLSFREGSGGSDMRHARMFPRVQSLTFEKGSLVTDEDFNQLDTRHIRDLHCHAGTQLTDRSIQRLDKSKLQSLSLYGPNFTDASLQGLSTVPRMFTLTLRDTQVTSKPFVSIDPTALIYFVDLANTRVDDEAVTALSRLPNLHYLTLSGTKVTGSTLKDLRGKRLSLNLDDTPFEERYLQDLLPPKGKPSTPPNRVEVIGLSLANVDLSEAAFDAIGKLTNLNSLDITGNRVSTDSFRVLGQLPQLRSLALDFDQLSDAMMHVGGDVGVHVLVDSDTISPVKACERIVALQLARREETGVTGSMEVSIQHAQLTSELARYLYETLDRLGIERISLRDAVLPTGTVRNFHDPYELLDQFPDLDR